MSVFNRLKHIPIASKLMLAFGAVVTLSLLVTGFAIYQLYLINATTLEMRSNWLVATRYLGEADGLLTDERRMVNAHILAVDAAEKGKFEVQIEAGRKYFRTAWEKYFATVTLPEEKALVRKFEREYARYRKEVEPVLALSSARKANEARELQVAKAGPAQDAARQAMREIVEFNQKGADGTTALASNFFESGWRLLGILAAMIVAVSAGMVLVMRRQLLAPIQRVTNDLARLAVGKTDISTEPEDRLDEIGRMTEALFSLRQAVEEQSRMAWIKASSTEIVAAMQGQRSMTDLARHLITRIAVVMGAQVGAFYYFDPELMEYRLLGSYGHQRRKEFSQHFQLGEGIVGQCAIERNMIILEEVPPDYIDISSGLGKARPRSVLVTPVSLPGGGIPAVIELASLKAFGLREQALLDEVLPMIAMGIEILERNLETQRLLDESMTRTAKEPTC